MGYIKTFIMDNQGAGWKSFDELTEQELAEIQSALLDTDKIQSACLVCYDVISDTTNGFYCESHRPQ